MFTGIVEEQGTVVALHEDGADAHLVVEAQVSVGVALGDSIAVDGVCLTVTAQHDGRFTADVMPETLSRTTLGLLGPGDRVNVERAVRADGRLDGHLVQGHVDGVGTLLSRNPGPRWDDLVVGCPVALARYVAEKGSICVDGISLTVTSVGPDRFGVSLIPTTLAATTLGAKVPGDQVNLEVDVIAKYVERLLGAAPNPADPSATTTPEGPA
ncbi:MAG TPA: riboflavin synthase [Actinotalea sp.]|nr:riboflavin synthase [Actinotalea sp.]